MNKYVSVVFVLFLVVVSTESKPALVSVYSEYGTSASGSLLWKYPARMRMTNGRSVRVYPAAVHTDMVKKYRYSVLQLKNRNGRRIYVHITDECNKRSYDCKKNHKKAKNMNGLLIDLHRSGMKPLKMRGWSLYRMQFKKIGKIVPKRMNTVLSYNGKKNYIPKNWKL